MSRTAQEFDANWRPRVLIIGAVAGTVLGLGTAYLLVRSADERHGGPPEVSTGDLLKVALGVVGLVRGIASLGS
jgi:hypothetical protein